MKGLIKAPDYMITINYYFDHETRTTLLIPSLGCAMGNGYLTLPCAKPTRGAGPGCHFGNSTQPMGRFLFCNWKKLPKMAVSSHFRPFCDRVLPGRVFGWQPNPPAGCQVGGLPEPKPGPTRPIAQPSLSLDLLRF